MIDQRFNYDARLLIPGFQKSEARKVTLIGKVYQYRGTIPPILVGTKVYSVVGYLDICLCLLSDDLEQDRPWAQQARCVILENERPKMMKHAAAKAMAIVKLCSDNCVGQLKNR